MFSISSISFSDLVTFTEEIPIGKLLFLYVTAASSQTQSVTKEPQINLLNLLSTKHLYAVPTNCLSVFDHFVGLPFKKLRTDSISTYRIANLFHILK